MQEFGQKTRHSTVSTGVHEVAYPLVEHNHLEGSTLITVDLV